MMACEDPLSEQETRFLGLLRNTYRFEIDPKRPPRAAHDPAAEHRGPAAPLTPLPLEYHPLPGGFRHEKTIAHLMMFCGDGCFFLQRSCLRKFHKGLSAVPVMNSGE
jgi:hypothetical protein